MRVLLVEDDAATAASIELMLRKESFIVDTTDLNIEQWGICLGASLLIVVVSELRKLLFKQPLDEVVKETTV